MNQLFQMMGNNNPYGGFMKQFAEFKKSFTGNPQQQVQQMLNSGKISQAQYDQAVQKANAIRSMFGM